MKVYLDTTVITLLLFGARTDPDRHREVTDFFAELDKGSGQAVVSIYALQSCAHFAMATSRLKMRHMSRGWRFTNC